MIRFLPRARPTRSCGESTSTPNGSPGHSSICPCHFASPRRRQRPICPFEDNYFDLVYGISVFTHISDLADAWFLELLRVLRPGGHAYLTIHDEHTVELLLGEYRDDNTQAFMVDLVRDFNDRDGRPLAGLGVLHDLRRTRRRKSSTTPST